MALMNFASSSVRLPRILSWKIEQRPSEGVFQVLSGYLALSKDLSQEAAAERLAAVHRDYGASAIRMAQKMMAAFRADQIKAQPPQGFDQALPRYGG
jgi:hypothetical protein